MKMALHDTQQPQDEFRRCCGSEDDDDIDNHHHDHTINNNELMLLDFLGQLSQDHHELKMDLSSVLLEEQLLQRLLERVQCRKQYMILDQQTPLMTTGDDSIRYILSYLDPPDLCSMDSTCKTVRRISQKVWKHRANEKVTLPTIPNNNKTTKKNDKERFLKWHLASSKAKQWEQHSARHTSASTSTSPTGTGNFSRHHHHVGCRGCSNFPDRLDTRPLHSVGDYDFFLRLSHKTEGLLFEGFVSILVESYLMTMIHNDNNNNLEQEQGDENDETLILDNEAITQDCWTPPSHPQILLNKLIEHLPIWKDIVQLATATATATLDSTISDNKAFEKAIEHLISNCSITLLALRRDKEDNVVVSSKDETMSNIHCSTSTVPTTNNNTTKCHCHYHQHQQQNQKHYRPILIVSTRGNKQLIEPRQYKHQQHDNDDNDDLYTDHTTTTSTTTTTTNTTIMEDDVWNIPLESSRMAAHFVDSADHVRSYVSELQVDIHVIGNDRLVLDFPDILIYPSSTSSSGSSMEESHSYFY